MSRLLVCIQEKNYNGTIMVENGGEVYTVGTNILSRTLFRGKTKDHFLAVLFKFDCKL